MKNKKEITPPAPANAVEAKKKGRPSNASSKRQLILTARAAAKAAGTFKKGRPSVVGSKRQVTLAARAEKIAAGIVIKKGRPKVIIESIVNDLVTLERGEVKQ